VQCRSSSLSVVETEANGDADWLFGLVGAARLAARRGGIIIF
jgi:hypothetical protein